MVRCGSLPEKSRGRNPSVLPAPKSAPWEGQRPGIGGRPCRGALGRVVTIESSLTFVDAHANIFGSPGLGDRVILGDEDRTDERPVQRRWSLDLPRIMEQIASWG